MTEWKSRNPTSSSSQSSIASLKNFLADGRLTPLYSPPPPPPPTTSGAPLVGGCARAIPVGQHYYHGRNAEQTPPPFPSMSIVFPLYSFLFCHL